MKLYEFFQLCCVLMVGSGCIWAILSAKPVKIGYIKNPCNLSPKNQDIEFKNFRNDLNHVFKYVSNIEQDFCLNQYISAKNANIVTNYKGELLKIYSDLSIDNYYKYIKEVNRIYKSVESLNNIIQSTLK